MKKYKIILIDRMEQVIKCKYYHKTTQGYLFVLEGTTKNFTLEEVKEVIPFVLPPGKILWE